MPENYFHLQWLYRLNGEIKSLGTWYYYQITGAYDPGLFINDVISRYDLPADADIEIMEVQRVARNDFFGK